jgi:hypothetical protein
MENYFQGLKLKVISEYEREENHRLGAISATVFVSIPNPKTNQKPQ